MKYVWCGQCDDIFMAKRSTAKYCSAKCRVAAGRQAKKEAKHIGDRVKQNETLLELIAEHNPKAFQHLSDLRNQKGLRAMDLALFAIADILKKDKIR